MDKKALYAEYGIVKQNQERKFYEEQLMIAEELDQRRRSKTLTPSMVQEFNKRFHGSKTEFNHMMMQINDEFRKRIYNWKGMKTA